MRNAGIFNIVLGLLMYFGSSYMLSRFTKYHKIIEGILLLLTCIGIVLLAYGSIMI